MSRAKASAASRGCIILSPVSAGMESIPPQTVMTKVFSFFPFHSQISNSSRNSGNKIKSQISKSSRNSGNKRKLLYKTTMCMVLQRTTGTEPRVTDLHLLGSGLQVSTGIFLFLVYSTVMLVLFSIDPGFFGLSAGLVLAIASSFYF